MKANNDGNCPTSEPTSDTTTPEDDVTRSGGTKAPYVITGKVSHGHTTPSVRTKNGGLCVTARTNDTLAGLDVSYKWDVQEYQGYQWLTIRTSRKMSANANSDYQCFGALSKTGVYRVYFYRTSGGIGEYLEGPYTIDGRG